jgi:hypothetical protein
MEPKTFFNQWVTICKTKNDILLENWKNLREYTSIVFNKENAIIKQIAEKLGLNSYCEYYSHDALLFDKEKDLVPNIPQNTTWVKRIRVAFEHEHNIRKAYEELSHLLITNCDLRVLVTYPEYDENDDLNYFREIALGGKIENSTSLLIIFGWREENNTIKWNGFEFKNYEWIKL